MIARLLIYVCLVVGIACNSYYYDDRPYLESIQNSYFQNAYYNPWHNETIRFLRVLSVSNQLDRPCKSSLRRWLNGLEEKERWAVKFLESTGKTLNGRLVGRNINFGSFEFCTGFLRSLRNNVDFDGKYCMVSVQTKESEIIKNQMGYQKYRNSISERSKRLLEFNVGYVWFLVQRANSKS